MRLSLHSEDKTAIKAIWSTQGAISEYVQDDCLFNLPEYLITIAQTMALSTQVKR